MDFSLLIFIFELFQNNGKTTMVKSLPPNRSNKYASIPSSRIQHFHQDRKQILTDWTSEPFNFCNQCTKHTFSSYCSFRVIDFYRKQRDALLAAADKWLSGEWNLHPVLG